MGCARETLEGTVLRMIGGAAGAMEENVEGSTCPASQNKLQ